MADGGESQITPTESSPTDRTGKNWNMPLDSGENRIHIFSEYSNQIQIESNSISETHYAIDNQEFRTGVTFTYQFTLSQPEVIRITTSTQSQLILQTEVNNVTNTQKELAGRVTALESFQTETAWPQSPAASQPPFLCLSSARLLYQAPR